MNTISIYSSLPYWLQNIAVSLHGYKLKRQRFNDDFYKILDFLNSTQGWSKEQIRSYKEEHIFKILDRPIITVLIIERNMLMLVYLLLILNN